MTAVGPAGAELAEAIETFVRGFCFTRSFTHPFICERVGTAWVMRDAPRRGGKYRTEEWDVHGMAADEIHRLVETEGRGRPAVCVIRGIQEDSASMRAALKERGYRLRTTEPLMVHRLRQLPKSRCPALIQRVLDPELASRLNKVARSRQVLEEHLHAQAALRQYAAVWGESIVAWVASIEVGENTWCSSMYVKEPYRRRGIGRALLRQMLADDRAHGSTGSVLLASHAGAKLYPVVGYQQIGELLLFMPARSSQG